jgi:hypothetical protein
VGTLFGPSIQPENRVECDDSSRHTAMFTGSLARFAIGMFDSPFTRQGVFVVGESRDNGVIFPSAATTVGVPRPAADFFIVLSQPSTQIVGRSIVRQMGISRLPIAQNITIPYFTGLPLDVQRIMSRYPPLTLRVFLACFTGLPLDVQRIMSRCLGRRCCCDFFHIQ